MKIYDEDFFYSNILKHSKVTVIKEVSEKENRYYKYEIPKKNGVREISAINKKSILYTLQYNLNNHFFDVQPLPVCVKGFVKGNGYFDFLYEHVSSSPVFFLRIDIKDFFNSITEKTLLNGLKDLIELDDILEVVIDICTLNGTLPQGAITSPSLSNLIFRRIDQRINLYCQSMGVSYTRYADDLLFSSERIDFLKKKWFLKKIKYIIKDINLHINYSKIKYGEGKLVLNGYVIGNDVNLSRKKMYKLSSLLYFFNKSRGNIKKEYEVDIQLLSKPTLLNSLNEFLSTSTTSDLSFESISGLQDFLIGYRSFLISCKNYSSSKRIEQYSNKIKHIDAIITALSIQT